MAGVSGRVLGQRGGCHTYPFDDEEPLDGYTRYNLGWMKVIYYYAQIQATPDMHTVMINGVLHCRPPEMGFSLDASLIDYFVPGRRTNGNFDGLVEYLASITAASSHALFNDAP